MVCMEVYKKVQYMTVGDRMRMLRNFRGMTQTDLGIAIGFPEKGANKRIVQYEINYRTPKKELLDEIAHVLRVNPNNFRVKNTGSLQDLMYELLWLDEEYPNFIHLFKMRHGAGTHPFSFSNNTVGIYFNSPAMNEFLNEWLVRKQELAEGKISKDDYREWKFNR